MTPRAHRFAALLALVGFAPVAGAAEHKIGDGTRLESAPRDLAVTPEVAEVSHGLVWLRLKSGETARGATKVPAGVYMTQEAWANASEAFAGRGLRIAQLEGQTRELAARLASAPPAPAPGIMPCPEVAEVKPASPFPWAVVAILGAVAFAGGVYVGARAATR